MGNKNNQSKLRLEAIDDRIFSRENPDEMLKDFAVCRGFDSFKSEDRERAQRLAACWNALRGISTEHLEKFGLPDFAQKISDMSEQCNELKSALKDLMEKPRSKLTLAKARSVIAKADKSP